MKNFYTLLITLLVSGFGFSQTTIYSEDFTGQNGKGAVGPVPTTDLVGVDWTIDISSTTLSASSDWFRVQSELFEARDIDGIGIWLSPIINISAYTNVGFSLDAGERGTMEGSDIFITEYRIDAGAWTQAGSNGSLNDDFTSAVVSQSATLLGNDLEIRVRMNNGAGSEYHELDNILVEGDLVGGGCTAPTTQASAYNTTSIGTTSATLNWTSGDGDEVLVVVKEGSAVDTDPTNGTAYTGNTAFGSGTEIGTGNYAVQSSSAASSVSITGLTAGTTYHVAVYEYNTTDTCYELTELTGDFTTTPVTTVEFDTTSASVLEDSGTYDLVIQIANEDAAATTFDVVLTSGDAADIDTYTTQSETFPGSSTTDIMVTVTITDDATIEADEVFTFEIQNVAGGDSAVVGTNNSFDLTILANDAPPPTDGWQISSEDTSFIIDFDTTVSGVNEGEFDGTGFVSSPATGQLDSDAWEVTGLSDGSLSYGGTGTSGDYTGSSTGGGAGSGINAFDTGSGNISLGIQPAGSDFTPGTITLRAQNQTGNTVTTADLAYLIYVYNDATRGNSFNFSYSTDDSTYTDVGALDLTSADAADGSPTWVSNSRSTPITGLSIANGDYLYLRWSGDDVSGSGSRDEFALDDIDLKFNPTLPTTYTYTGTWSPSDPNGAATASEFIVIASGNATIDTNTTCDSVTVNAGAGLTVDTTITLTTTNGLTLESTSTSYSSLILDGTIAGTVNYERHVNGNSGLGDINAIGNNDLISPPLSGQAFGAFASANSNLLANPGDANEKAFAPFDKTTGAYENYLVTTNAATTLDAGVGYRAATNDTATLIFTGTVNTGSVTNNIVNSGPTFTDWNLVGNPYPSYLKVQDFLNYEVASGVKNLDLFVPTTAAIYGYDGDAAGGGVSGYTIYNLANTTPTTIIAPGQGFLVSADAADVSMYDVTFDPTMRATGATDDFIVGRGTNAIINLELNISSASDSFVTNFYFNENASLGLDPGYDAAIFGSTPSFALYSLLVEDNMGTPFAIQAVSLADLMNINIPLGVNANSGEQLVFTISESTLSDTVDIYLDDTLNNTSTLLNTSDYIITPNTNLNGTGRFYLRIADSSLSTLDNNSLNGLNIYSNQRNKTIVIAGQLIETTNVKVYDIQGRIVSANIFQNENRQQIIDVSSLNAGIYVVELVNGTQNKTQKVIIR